ncbi:MAG: type II and III secretion system protein family protein [Micavibrio sp.]|nr:type II and III secretion system protein family protein [Micavibrio sp.]
MCFILPAFSVGAEKADLQAVGASKQNLVTVTLGKAELVDLPGDVADVMVANSSVVDVRAVQSNRLYLVGLEVGDTNLIALDADGNVIKRLDIHVTYDLMAIQSMINDLFPSEGVKVGSIHNQVLLTGRVSTPEASNKIVNLVGRYAGDVSGASGDADQLVANMLDVRGEQQVMLQVRIVEASRNVLKQLGLETYANADLASTTNRGDQIQFLTGAGIGLTRDPAGILSAAIGSGINGLGLIGLELNALEEENLVNILAEPNLTAVSGEQAGFLAGGEFPVPVGRDQVGNLVIEFREFGVSLNFVPRVMSDKRISLQMNTEVSSLDFDNAITLAQVQVPGLDVRRAETTVEIASGASLMIAGLIQSDAIEDMSGLPGIKDTPILGDLVSSRGFRRDETELIVLVTPYLVEPYAEKEIAEVVAAPAVHPELARAFAANIKRNYDFKDNELLSLEHPYGYILD